MSNSTEVGRHKNLESKRIVLIVEDVKNSSEMWMAYRQG